MSITERPQAREEWHAFRKMAPEGAAALLCLTNADSAAAFVEDALPAVLIELVKLRVSQINGCAYCLAYHAAELAKLSAPESHVSLVPAWREAPVFEPRERAAFAWAEALTRLSGEHGPSDELYDAVSAVLTEAQLAQLTAAIASINAWNRVGIAYRFNPPQNAAAARPAA